MSRSVRQPDVRRYQRGEGGPFDNCILQVLAKHQTGRRTQLANALCRYVELARVTQVP